MKNGKITMSAEYNSIDAIMKLNNIELFGFCRFENVLPLLPCRAVARVPLNAKTIIMCAFPYLVKEPSNVKRNISYYACVPDYHIVVMDMLRNVSNSLKKTFPNYTFEPFADNSPIREVKASQLAGLGCVGKNGLLITKKYGSYVFLGEVVTDMDIDCTEHNEVCIGCGLCANNCPTKSIGVEGIKEDTCLSNITQKKGELLDYEKNLMVCNHTAWGCDMCQTICPMNKDVAETYIQAFITGANHILTEDNISKKGAYYWRGRKTIVRNINILNKGID